MQIFFLGHRARQHLELATCPESAIADRSIYEDAYIFVRALHHMGNLSERDYQSYQALYDLVMTTLPRPDLLLYLRAPVPVLMQRIYRRGRTMESSITADYLSLLDTFYEEWIESFNLCPVLTIRSGDLDFVHKPKHLDIVPQRIQDKLSGREDVIFPTAAGASKGA